MNTAPRFLHPALLLVLLLVVVTATLSACSVARQIRYAAFPETEEHLVGSGETIYSIAFQHELDYRDLARWNQLQAPYKLHVGQALVLNPYRSLDEDRDADADTGPVATVASTSPREPVAHTQPLPPQGNPEITAVAPPASAPVPPPKATPVPDKTAAAAAPPVESQPPASQEPVQVAIAAPPSFPPPPVYPATAWVWPAQGKVQAAEAPGGLDRKGIEILGKLGDPVRAAHSGRVVYAGTGLKGYGRLLIVKHDEVYLSAYAHNSRVLVKEGDEVKTGQVIALMGLGPKSQPLLYFELRRKGKPVSPTTKLPER